MSEANTPFYRIMTRLAWGRWKHAKFMDYLAERYPESAERSRKEAREARLAAWEAIIEAREARERHVAREAA